MKIELAEVVEAWEERGIRFKAGQVLMGEYMGQGLLEPVFKTFDEYACFFHLREYRARIVRE